MAPAADNATLWLASASPRRRQLLEDAGYAFRVRPADVDDGLLSAEGRLPAGWTMALAYLKARRVADGLAAEGIGHGIVLGADTVCTRDAAILGQPADVREARTMLEMLQDATHMTITGVCLLDLATGRRLIFHDAVQVMIGRIDPGALEAYLAGGDWAGKAGGYNLADRVADGWPIRWIGDPATVMGMPIHMLRAVLPPPGTTWPAEIAGESRA